MSNQDNDLINGRLHNSFFEQDFENTSYEVGDDLITKYGKKINVYKFKKESGAIRLTNEGERSLNYSNDSFRQTTNIYTGRNPITVFWEDSTKLVVENGKKIIKEVKVGTYYELYFNSPNNTQLVVDNVNILNKDYVNSYINRDITLYSYDWNPSDNDILDYVYLIFDKRNKSLQWLEISSIEPYFHENTKKHIYTIINFENVNLKYSKTGKTLIDFIQLGAIGEGYCFPKEDEEGNVSLDQDKLLRENEGANRVQFDFNGGTGNSSFIFWGRRKEKMVNGKIEIDTPHILLPLKINFPKSGEFFYNQPNSNSYAIINALPTKQGIWASYKESYKGNDRIGEYNVDKQKQVLTGFDINLNETRNTNPNLSTFINWDNTKNVDLNLNVDLSGIPYINTSTTTINRKLDYTTFFIINSFLNWSSDVFNFDYRETTKYKLTDTLGVLGSLINVLVGGLDIGWTSSNSLGPKQPINFLCPCISFEDGKAALSDKSPLPTDIFIDDNEKKILPTTTNILTSWNMTLTEYFIDKELVIPNAPLGKGGRGIWNTKYLGQTKDEEGNWLFQDKRKLLLNLERFEPFSIASEVPNFIIDYVDFKAVGQSDYRISAYNFKNETIYSSYQETFSKARDEITLWGNRIKFNFYNENNTQGQLQWPENVLPPKPQEDHYGFIIKDSIDRQLFKDPKIFNRDNEAIFYNFDFFNLDFLQALKGSMSNRVRANDPNYFDPYWDYYFERTFNPLQGQDSIYYDIPFVVKDNEKLFINLGVEVDDINNFEKIVIEFFGDKREEINIIEGQMGYGFTWAGLEKEFIFREEDIVLFEERGSGKKHILKSTNNKKALELSFNGRVALYFGVYLEEKQLRIECELQAERLNLKEIEGKEPSLLTLPKGSRSKYGDFKNPFQNLKIKKIILIPKVKK